MKPKLAELKLYIKNLGANAHQRRIEARAFTGMDRWHAQREAHNGAREYLLAYGFLRGRKLSGDRGMEPDSTLAQASQSYTLQQIRRFADIKDGETTADLTARIDAICTDATEQFRDQARQIALRKLGISNTVKGAA